MRASIFVMLFCMPGLLLAAGQDRELSATGEIGIDPQGGVDECRIETELAAELKDIICRSASKWRFEPISVQNKPTHVRSKMYLTLNAHPVSQGFELRVDKVHFSGERASVSMRPPVYPREAARIGMVADVLLAVHVDGDGNVMDVVAAQSPWLNVLRADRSTDKWRKRFEDASIAAARKWKFTPVDLSKEFTPDTTLLVPVTFRMDHNATFGGAGWRANSTTARPIPWLAKDQQQYDATGLKEGQTLALGGSITLVTDVVGSLL